MSSVFPSLEPTQSVERALNAGGSHEFRLDLPHRGYWRLEVEQLGIDIQLSLEISPAEQIVVDSPLDRAGRESLIFHVDRDTSFPARVDAQELAAPTGRYRVRLEAFPQVPGSENLLLEAEEERMEAARHYAAERRREAFGSYLRAFDLWSELELPAEQARDLYCAAVLARLLGETQRALALGRRVLKRWQELDDPYWLAATWNEMGLNQWAKGKHGEARSSYREAIDLRAEIGDELGAQNSQTNLCVTFLTEGQLRRGQRCYGQVLEALDADREPSFAAAVHINAGWTSARLGEPDRAAEHYEKALSLTELAGDRQGQAQTLNNLARLLHGDGRLDEALVHYEKALDLLEALEDARWQGIVQHNIGLTYMALGEPRRALGFLRRALDLRRRSEHRRGEAATLSFLGWIHHHLEEPSVALAFHKEAIEVAETVGDARQLALLLQAASESRAAAGEKESAIEDAERALALLLEVGDRPGEAAARHQIGRLIISSDVGAPGAAPSRSQAAESLEKALLIRREIRDRFGEAETLTALALLEKIRGNLHRANTNVEEAIDRIEGLRSRIGHRDLRATFQSVYREAYELQVEILMDLHGQTPNRGYDLEALAASERSRARALLDLLLEPGQAPRWGDDPARQERRQKLERRLNAKASRLTSLLSQPDKTGEAIVVEREMETILHHLERVEAEIRRADPRYADLTRPRTLDASQMQALLDGENVLLHYSLGEERSFLWWVATDMISVHELAGRAEIEEAARRFHRDLSATPLDQRRSRAAASGELYRLLLGPVASRLGNQRLVIVADGALHYLPFAALQAPGTAVMRPGRQLLVDHEIVSVPSATVLSAQRRRRASRPAASRGLAVMGDPVFDRADIRFPSEPNSPSSPDPLPEIREIERSPRHRSAERPRLRRLPASGREAAAIADLVGDVDHLKALGFEATRERMLGGELRDYRVIHLATHGIIDAETPRLSGLVFSQFDRAGQPRDGFLRLHDLYGLELASELVVLSGCQTALGREIRGEGLIGMTHGFLYAGASRVIASLWPVEDRATEKLMVSFYRAMIEDGERPAAALRSAQLSLRSERRWRDPYHWSAFILVGEWRHGAIFQSQDVAE